MIAAAQAAIPDQVLLSSDTVWLVAEGPGSATLTVSAFNQSTPLSGLEVEFECLQPEMGSISPASGITDEAGFAYSNFQPSTVSGSAGIRARVYYEENGTIRSTDAFHTQEIDHAIPYDFAAITYENEVTAGSSTQIAVYLEDRYGNAVDNLNSAEMVTFVIGSVGGNARLWDGAGYVQETALPVNESGAVTITAVIDDEPGENIVWIDPPTAIPEQYLTIYGIANGLPCQITSGITPSAQPYPYQPADGESQFLIAYTLYDEFGNPAGNRDLSITTSIPGEEQIFTTNAYGKRTITYGPKDSAQLVEIIATAVDNTTVNISQTVQFVNTEGVDMILTASPDTMASRDVKDDLTSLVRAKVIDEKGNPVSDETVTFIISGFELDGPFHQTTAPLIEPESAITDDDGYAQVAFHPGAFTINRSDTQFSDTASGTATVQATWDTTIRTVDISYRNYPYLSVETFVSPETAEVNQTVNVTVRLRGDGWALQERPIDVVLCTDRSGSMLKNTTNYISESDHDRMVHAMDAATDFAGQLNPAKDRIGLVSFGESGTADLDSYGGKYLAGVDYYWFYFWWLGYSDDDDDYIAAHYHSPQTYASYATADLNLTFDYTDVNSQIGDWLPMGGTPLREGIYRAVTMLLDNPRTYEDPVEAIVLLTDGEWNTGGDPEGGSSTTSFPEVGTGSVIDYAEDGGVTLYTIALGNEPNHGELADYATQTGGEFYSVANGDDLSGIYESIASSLRETAGVNTRMDLSFETLEVNGESVAGGGEDGVLEYIPSTDIISYNDTSIVIPQYSLDQSDDWNGNPPPAYSLHFDVGTIGLNQVWEANFSMKVMRVGNINLFGNGSVITFNNGTESITLPDTYLTVLPELANIGPGSVVNLTIEDLETPNGDNPGDFLAITWNLNYSGSSTITERLSYSYNEGPRDTFETRQVPATATSDATFFDVRNRPSGSYNISVYAYTIPDEPDDTAYTEVELDLGSVQKSFIRIE